MSAPHTDLAALCRHLEDLGEQRPTPEARAELETGLGSKWDGVVVTSARSLSKWGDVQSVTAIRKSLVEKSQLQHRWATAGALAEALAPHLSAADLKWVVPLVVRDSNRHYRWALFRLLAFTPKGQTLRELKSFEGVAGVDPKDLRHVATFVEMQSRNDAA